MKQRIMFCTFFFILVFALIMEFTFALKTMPVVRAGGQAVEAMAESLENGDVNGDGMINIADAIYLLRYLFNGTAKPVTIAHQDPPTPPFVATGITFDGETIQGLKGFTYKVYKDRQDVRGIGSDMDGFIGITCVEGELDDQDNLTFTVYGRTLEIAAGMMQDVGALDDKIHVRGTITVDCENNILNKHMDNNTSLQIITSIKTDLNSEDSKQFILDGCLIKDKTFQQDSGGHTTSTSYTFTADRMREA